MTDRKFTEATEPKCRYGKDKYQVRVTSLEPLLPVLRIAEIAWDFEMLQFLSSVAGIILLGWFYKCTIPK